LKEEQETEVLFFCPECSRREFGPSMESRRPSSGRTSGGEKVGLFTINLELGEATLKTLRDIAKTSVVRFELGPETRAMIERLAAPSGDGENEEGSVGRLVAKGAKALRSE
jgi:hypothetical protein